jgi:glycosyltransferase involved in cell wall biosynthesis
LLHFAEGVYAAHFIRQAPCDHIHAHFVDRAATVALVVSRLLDIPYSVTAHANDIYVNPVLLEQKLSAAKFVATCTAYNKEHLSQVDGVHLNGKLHCIYHGLDLEDYQPGSRDCREKVLLTAVGQLKEKKGFSYLLKACRLLKERGYVFSCQIIGEGPLRGELERQIGAFSLGEEVILRGALPYEEVMREYNGSDIFVLPCIIGANGDRDGIPNVILEALAMELPVVSTRHLSIPEVIEDGVNGLLVPPADETALADVLAKLLNDFGLRISLGKQGRATVSERFDSMCNAEHLLEEMISQ